MFSRTESFSQYIRLYPVVTFFLAVNILIYLLTILPVIGGTLFNAGIGVNGLISAGEWWRLITPMFLHGGIMHILFNMFCLFVFGPELEKVAGRLRFLTIYIFAGLFGNLATFFLHGPEYSHVGASGAIFGIFGAFAALVHYTKKVLPQLKQIILPIILVSVIMTFLQPGINATAHIAGLAVGFLIGLGYFHPKRIAHWKQSKR